MESNNNQLNKINFENSNSKNAIKQNHLNSNNMEYLKNNNWQKTQNIDKNILKKLKIKPFEIVFLIIDILIVILTFVLFEKNILSFSCSFVGCFAIFFLAKGFFFAPIFNVIYDILYIILSFTQNYFGEAIIYVFMTLPIDIYSVFSWKKNKTNDSNVIKINILSKKEWLFFWIGTVCLTITFYFILDALNTSELIISTISFVTSAMAGYFLIRRNNFYSLAYAFNDLVLIGLWTMSVIKISPSYLPMVINFCCNFIIDSYGFINLQKELKLQNKNLNANSNKI